MKITQDGPSQRQAVLTIEVEPQDLEPYLERAYRRLAPKVALPGFRPGRAPRALVERALGRKALLSEALDLLLPEVTRRAVQEQCLEPSAPPRVEVTGTEPVTLRATVPLAPLVEVGDYRSLRIPVERPVVTEEQVTEALEALRRDTATWVPVERAVREGDLVVLDLRGTVDGRPVLQQKQMPYIVDRAAPFPLPGFAQKLEGMARGQEQAFDLPFPQEYPDKSLAGRTCHLTLSLHEVKERHLPALDDQFAKGLGKGFHSLEALKEDIRRRLQEAQEARARRQHQERVVKALMELSRVELPPLLTEREIDHLLEDERRALAREGVSLEERLQQMGKTLEAHREDLRPQAAEALTRTTLLNQVADLEGVQVDPEEVKRWAQEGSPQRGREKETWLRFWEEPTNQEALVRSLRRQKALERLSALARGEALIVPGPASPSPERTKAGESA